MTWINLITVSIAACSLSTAALAQQVVGSIPGTFDVTLSGSATYSVPVRVAPGTAGVEPKLSLVYDSQALGGPLGAGWAIGGLSAITRGPKNARFDGIPDGVKLSETDALYLDGQRLVGIKTTGAGATRQIEYRKEDDDQTRITEIGVDFGSSTFVVNTKGGLTITFVSVPGATSDENRGDVRFSDNSVLLRAESRVSDSAGNFIDFYYHVNGNGNYDIKTIRYTGHKSMGGSQTTDQPPYAAIEFQYEAAPRFLNSFVAGRSLVIDSRLVGIVTKVAANPQNSSQSSWLQVARYSFEYEDRDTASRFVLKAINQFGEDNSELIPTHFSYSAPMTGWKSTPYTFPAILASHEEMAAGYRFAHVSTVKGGLPDLLYAVENAGQLESFSFENDKTSWSALSTFNSPIPFATSDGSDLGVIVADVNGDGRADLLQSYQLGANSPVLASYIAGPTKFDSQPGFNLPFLVSKDGKPFAKYRLAHWTGAAGPDLIYQAGDKVGFLANTPTGWNPNQNYSPPLDLGDNTWVVDIDCSGKPALVGAVKGSDGSYFWKVYKFGPTKWDEITDDKFRFPFPADVSPDAVRILSVDGSNCPAVLVATAQGAGLHGVYQASADKGWQAIVTKTPKFDLVDSAGRASGAVVAQVDDAHLSDVFANRVFADGHAVKFMYFQTATGWTEAPNTFGIPILSQASSGESVHPFIKDFDGDGRADIALPGNSRQSFGRLLIATDSGFVENINFAPPVAFAQKGTQDLGVRMVDLTGDGLADILVSQSGGPAPGAWLNTGNGWVQQTGLTPPVPFAGGDIAGSPAQFVDVDGDGFVDLLYSYRDKNGTTSTKLYRNIAAGDGTRKWSDASTDGTGYAGLVPPADYPFAADKIGDMGVRFADVTGTGRPYMLVGFQPGGAGAAPKLAAFKNDGTNWVSAPEYAPPIPFVAQIAPPNTASPDLTDASHDLFVQIVDVNGDGLPDIVAKYHDPANPSSVVEGVWLNTGSGWQKDPTFSIPVALDTLDWDPNLGLQWEKNASIQWADVNGDGIPDILYTRREGSTNKSTTYIGTGHGWVAAPQWQVPIDALADRGGDPGLRIIDVNGDGYPDLLFARQETDGTITQGLFINNGNGWLPKDTTDVPNLPFVDKDGNDLGVRLLDVNGKGLLDIIEAYKGDAAMPTVAIMINQARRSDVIQSIDAGYGLVTDVFYQSLIEPIAPDLGATELPIRQEYSWPTIYEPVHEVLTYPTVAPIPASYLVRRAVVSESAKRHLAYSYKYGGYRMDALGKNSLGFAWRESVNEANGVMTHVDLSQDVDSAGKSVHEGTCWLDLSLNHGSGPISSNACRGAGSAGYLWVHPISTTDTTWQVEKGPVGGNSLPNLTIRQVALVRTISASYELDGRKTEWHTDSLQYDEPAAPLTILDRRMNVLQSTTTWGDGATVATVSSYDADDLVRWFLGRLTKSTVTKSIAQTKSGRSPPQAEVRSVGFSYDSETGLLHSQTINLGTSREVTTSYDRDIYGNILKKHIHANGIVDSNPTTITYDSIGRFAISTANALNQTTSQQSLVTSGLPSQVTDANGVSTSYEYDGFGRLTRVHAPSGQDTTLTASTEYVPLASISAAYPVSIANAAYAVRLQTTDGSQPLPFSVKVLDAKGRTLRSISEGFSKDGGAHRLILRDTGFDIFGQSQRASLPYEVGRSPKWATVVRDVFGRVIKQTAADGGVVQYIYGGTPQGGLVTTLVDKRRATPTKTITTINMRNLPTLVVDPRGGRVQYHYDAGGKPTTVTDPLGNTTVYTYDNFGNRVSVSDPDAGKWMYEYDALGRLIKKIDTKAGANVVTQLDYDALGRVRQETRPTEVWTWEFDSQSHGIGKLAAVKDDAGKYLERYSYDELGRIDSKSVTIATTTYTSSQTYDSFGRISRVGYPGNFAVNNVYSTAGYLLRVEDAVSQKPYWSLGATDSFGNVTGAEYGNGVHLDASYDDTTDRPKELRAANESGDKIIDLNLNYDLAGDLRQRSETVQNKSEQFNYDILDRLTSLQRPDGSLDRYTYDAGGRFLAKSGTSYIYGNETKNSSADCSSIPYPAHAVLATVIASTRQAYNYDCHGNMTASGTNTYSYSSDGRLISAKRPVDYGIVYTDEFDYGPNGSRYRETAKHGARKLETISLGGYDRITEFGMGDHATTPCFVRNRYYVSNGTGTFAVVEKSHQEFNCLVAAAVFHVGAAGVGDSPKDTQKTWYLHRDQQGSILAITDETGAVRAKYWYDPWGVRTSQILDQDGILPGMRLEDSWSRGFLSQEHLQDFDLIHLNGRVYDPHLGMFLSPDPINQDPLDGQNWNPFAYSRNNPLRYSDPNGYSWLGDAWNGFTHAIGQVGNAIGSGVQAVGHAFDEAGKWLGQNWRQVVIVAAVVAVTVLTAGAGGPEAGALGSAILSGMAAGATAGGLSAALYGGNLDDVLTGAIKGGVIGAFSGAAFYGVGSLTAGGGTLNGVEGVAGHGLVGGAQTVANGGNFWQGFESGTLTKASSLWVPTFDSGGLNVARAALVGGGVAALDGGNFANGAITGAFSYAFNDAMHPPRPQDDAIYPTASPIDFALMGAGSLYEAGAAFLDELLTEEGIVTVEQELVVTGSEASAQEGFFEGTRYTDKVLEQMENKADLYHSFPELITTQESAGQSCTIIGGDGVPRQMLEIPGSVNGTEGVYQFIKDSSGAINHRLFLP